MKKTALIFKSECDQLPLHFTLIEPEGAPLGVLQIAHGMAEHRARYFPFAEYLAAHGYAVIVGDHRGHGDSVRSKDDLGYFYDEGARYLVEDLHQITLYGKSRFPTLPYFLFGHSMGSLAVRAYTKKYDSELDGLIVCGSPSFNPAAGAGRALAKSLMKIHGDRYRSTKINEMAFGAFNKRFSDSSSKNNWISSDPAVIKAYDSDPLCGYIFTLNGFVSLFDLMHTCYSEKNWVLSDPELPVWFIAGEDDPCITDRRHFLDAISLMQYVGYENVTYRLYPKMRHEILNEIGKEKVYSDILSRLEAWRAAK